MLSVVFIAAASHASATMMGLAGVVVDYEMTGSGILGSATVTVGPGVEIACPADQSFSLCAALSAPTQTLDIGDWTIRYEYSGDQTFPRAFSEADFGGLVFSGLDIGGSGIQNVSLDTNMTGLNSSRLSFTGDSIAVNLQNLGLVHGSYFELTVGDSQAAPEPAAGILLASALASLLVLSRRRCGALKRMAP